MSGAMQPYDPGEVRDPLAVCVAERVEETDYCDAQEILNRLHDAVMERAEQGGCMCPVCDQIVKTYRYTLNRLMLSCLEGVNRATEPVGVFKHISEFEVITESGERVEARAFGGVLAKLRYWGLIEGDGPQDSVTARGSGKWRITSEGAAFLRGEVCVEQCIVLYNGQLLRREGTLVGVHDILDKRRL